MGGTIDGRRGDHVLLMVGGAAFFWRLARRSESDFFLAGRGLPWWLPASSVFSTHTATDTPMWITGVIYAHGLRGLWYTFFTAWTAGICQTGDRGHNSPGLPPPRGNPRCRAPSIASGRGRPSLSESRLQLAYVRCLGVFL